MVGSLLAAAASVGGASAPWISGERIHVGGNGRGPLSAALTNFPQGTAFIYGSRFPDLFLAGGRFAHEPGLFLYRWLETAAKGAPVFGRRVPVGYPGDAASAPPGVIFQTRAGKVYGFWIIKGALIRTRFDRNQMRFATLPVPPIPVEGLPGSAPRTNSDGRTVERVAVHENSDGTLDLILSVSDRTAYYPTLQGNRSRPDYRPYDGAGIWRGGWPNVFLYAGRLPGPEAAAASLLDLRQVSATQHESLLSQGNLAILNLGVGHERDLVTGSHFGDFYYYHNRATGGVELAPHELLRDPDGRVLRHPTIWPSPVAFSAADGKVRGLIAGGEGALYYYRFAGFNRDGVPSCEAPVPVLEENALLYSGTLPVVNAVDWDGDGATDLLAGNSEGRILFFRNAGSDDHPDLAPGVPLAAGGVTIHVQQGYAALQGPDEASWGYVAPTVADWNGDGLPDILMGDATGRHTVYMNSGTRRVPQLDAGQPLYCDGLEVHGTWRSRPAVARCGAKMAYVALDDDDELRLYWRIDDCNVRDAGKLKLEDGSPIRANYLPAGGTGRARLTLFDWDGDGVMDLLIGTPRHGSVPNPNTGLPQSNGLPGATVLWLRNVGTNTAPVFAFPKVLYVRGRPAYFGQHECSVAATTLAGHGPNLIVGDEEGRIYFFRRQDISWGSGR